MNVSSIINEVIGIVIATRIQCRSISRQLSNALGENQPCAVAVKGESTRATTNGTNGIKETMVLFCFI